MSVIVPPGQFNAAALTAADLYIQILNPPSYIRGVPTDVVGMVGTASWGPVNTAVHMGSSLDGAAAFGPISAASLADVHDLATDIVLAFGQASSQASLEGFGVRVTDGTDTAATGTLPGAASHAAEVATLGGTVTSGDTLSLTATGGYTGSPQTVTVTAAAGDTLTSLAARLAAGVNTNAAFVAADFYASAASGVVSLYVPSAVTTTWSESTSGGATETITLSTGAAASAGITLTTVYTGVLGNLVQATVQAAAQTGGFTVSILPPSTIGGVAEVFPNIPGTNFWSALQSAINNGLSGVRGPSQIVKASNANNAVGVPTVATQTLAGGTDGRAGVTTSTLLGSDTAQPRTGLYALRNQQPPVGISWIVGCTDSNAISPLKQFGLSDGSAVLQPFATGTSTATAIAAVATNGVHDPSLTYVKDWVYFFDSVNNQVRLVPPTAVVAGVWATYSPEQSPLNKTTNLVIGTDRLPPNTNAQGYTDSEIGQLASSGITLITNPIPAGTDWGVREGQSTSLDPATQPMEWWRMTSYLARSISGAFGKYVGPVQSQQPNDPLRQAVKGSLNQFFQELIGLGQIDGATVICSFSRSASPGMGVNTPASIAQHYLYALCSVTYLSTVRYLILSLQGGTTVVQVTGGQQVQS